MSSRACGDLEEGQFWSCGVTLGLFMALSVLGACSSLPTASAGPSATDSNVSATVMGIGGGRSFRSGSVFGSSHQPVFGINAAVIPPGAPFGLEGGGFWSDDSGGAGNVNGDIRIQEGFIGIWRPIETGGGVRPYLGVGGTVIHAEANTNLGPDHDTTTGMYLHGGVFFNIGRYVVIIADLRTVVLAHLELGGSSGDADYTQFALGLGVQL